MTLLNETAQQHIRKRTRQVVLLTLLTVVLSWSGALPELFACGEPPFPRERHDGKRHDAQGRDAGESPLQDS